MTMQLTTVASKQQALKARVSEQKQVDMEVDKLVKLHVDGEIQTSVWCLSKLLNCPGFRLPSSYIWRTAVSTEEQSTAQSSSTHTSSVALVDHKLDLLTRFVGRSKKEKAETVRIADAMKTVQARVEDLQDRVNICRERALVAKKANKHEDALREMKKSKAAAKQLATAMTALETLERQEDLLAQSSLQRELAAALSTTNKEVKKKHKGLLGFAEHVVDDAVELKDYAEDIGAVFDGLVTNSVDETVDEKDLLEELECMVADEQLPVEQKTHDTKNTKSKENDNTNSYASFPNAPQSAAVVNVESKSLLLRDAHM